MRLTAIAVLWAAVLAPQDVGMGRREGSGARFERPYTLDIETPHVKWAKPLKNGPVRVLAVPTVSEGRTIVEIAQRLDLDLTTVSIDPAWDRNKWTMSFGRDYGARAEKGDLSLIYRYLEEELTSAKRFDVILMPVNHGWERLTEASRQAIDRRVREGAGLVIVRPMDTDISPLRPVTPGKRGDDASAPVEPGSPESNVAWKRAAKHYITAPIPVENFPFEHLGHYAYEATPDSTVLIATETGKPVAAVRTHGKGRVVAFGYRNSGLSWYMPMSANGYVTQAQWEAFYAMLCRAVLYAARRESDAPAHWNVELPPPAQPDVQSLAVDKRVIAVGEAVRVTFTSATPVRVELIDGFGRVLARTTATSNATLQAGRPLTHSGFVVAGTAKIPVRFAASDREWTDYEVIMPWYGPGSYQPWIGALDEQYRRAGITALASPERNFKLVASAGLHDVFGVYAYRNQKYKARKAAYAETKDKRYLTRDVVLQDPSFEPELRDQLTKRIGPLAPLKPLAYYLADESSLTTYTDAFDVDWAPSAIAGFRRWVQNEYKTLEALNAAWGTSFKDWNSVVPMTTEEAQRHGNFAPWSDHRVYMEQEFVKALDKARKIVAEIDPGAPASISGTQVPTAHNGANWYEIDQRIDYLQPYSGGNQDAMHHLFRPGIKLTGFTGYGTAGAEAHYQQWQRLFYGHTGASIFWHYTVFNPDLTLSEQGRELAAVFGRIQSGIGRVFMNSTVREDGVAIHFSMNSIRGAWITDGKIRPTVGNVRGTSKAYDELVARRDKWVKELESKGIQFRFLATPQIENGALDSYKALILPYSIALSDAEIAAIHRFIARGGRVYADEQTGRMDERCRWRKDPPVFDRAESALQSSSAPFGPDFLTAIRDFGAARLIGALPKDERIVSLPPTSAIRYDLLRGGPAQSTLKASPQEPILLIERSTRIAPPTVSPDLLIRLSDEKGQAIDKSVVQVKVFDPDGKLVRHYSGNATIRDGRAQFQIPFALNDAKGNWRVQVRDVISGLTAERAIMRL